jgi:ubiquinone/menaquinone biosynthesis C-methylase UbiE
MAGQHLADLNSSLASIGVDAVLSRIGFQLDLSAMFRLFGKRDEPSKLVVGIIGAKMGDRIAQVGCADGARLAALAAAAGLSGRAVAIVPDGSSAARARKAASAAGVLVEVEIGPPSRLPLDKSAVDVAIVDDTDHFFAALDAEARGAAVRELFRILRPGGRVVVVTSGARSGLSALLSRSPSTPTFDPTPFLQAEGFRSIRTLAERDGLAFVEAIRPR